jgi:hypothetical protein
MPGLDPGIHAKASLAQRFHRRFVRVASAWTTGIGVRRTPFLHTAMPGGDESESRVTVASHSSGAKARRENEILFSTSPQGGEVERTQ